MLPITFVFASSPVLVASMQGDGGTIYTTGAAATFKSDTLFVGLRPNATSATVSVVVDWGRPSLYYNSNSSGRDLTIYHVVESAE